MNRRNYKSLRLKAKKLGVSKRWLKAKLRYRFHVAYAMRWGLDRWT